MFRKLATLVLPLLVGVLLSGYAPEVQSQNVPPDSIYYNGHIVTVDDHFSYAQAFAIRDDKFVAVGSTKDIRNLAGPQTKLIDLKGLTVTPGFTDNHLHSAGGGPGVDLSRSRTLNDLLKAIGDRVKESKPGDVVVTNGDWHEGQLKEQRVPLRRDLDTVSAAVPVVVIRGGHEFILNSAALAKWNITTGTPAPEGGRISRYDNGELNGELVDRARQLVSLPPPAKRSFEERIQDQMAEYAKLHEAGLTAVRHPSGSIEDYRLRKEMERRGILTMRITQLLSVDPRSEPGKIEQEVKSWNVNPDEGDAWIRIGGIGEFSVDGGFEGGFMSQPYKEPFGEGGKFRGLQTVPQDTYTANTKVLNKLGWRIFSHAVGDAAIDEVLTGYEAANQEKSIVGRRWGIEHAFIPTADEIARMKKLSLFMSLQDHLYVAGPSLVKYWGIERASLTTPVKTYMEAGLPVSGGTDSPTVPYPPLWVFYHFITRDTISGGVLGANQKISREDALRMITRNHYYLNFQEVVNGVIAPGRYADLVVLPEDITTAAAKDIEQMKVMMTMVGGKVVYADKKFTALTRVGVRDGHTQIVSLTAARHSD
jgi:predicted amidohydrolase YtcJ